MLKKDVENLKTQYYGVPPYYLILRTDKTYCNMIKKFSFFLLMSSLIINVSAQIIDLDNANKLFAEGEYSVSQNLYQNLLNDGENEDFLIYKPKIEFDYIIGNPPYNSNGMKKVPTNNKLNKKQDGKTIWHSFIKRAVSLLKRNGGLVFIVPSIWMKPDKAEMYHYLTSYKLEKIKCLTNTKTNSIFSGEAQTPTCMFYLINKKSTPSIQLYDKDANVYIDYLLKNNQAIPIFGQKVMRKLTKFLSKAGCIKVHKTNMPSKTTILSPCRTDKCTYPNIKTCLLNGLDAKIIINYSNIPQAFYKKNKLVLAHKMYGFPYIDYCGDYGISNRDNYVITDYTIKELKILQSFFATKTALYFFESTRYRMKYLEKYVFELIPNILNLPDFPQEITDESIAEYFGFDEEDQNNINSLHKKNYIFLPSI